MRHTFRYLLLIAVTVAAIAPSAATAGPAGGATCGKNYSQNSVNGDYCAPAAGFHAGSRRHELRQGLQPQLGRRQLLRQFGEQPDRHRAAGEQDSVNHRREE